jgi:hypothetical protein
MDGRKKGCAKQMFIFGTQTTKNIILSMSLNSDQFSFREGTLHDKEQLKQLGIRSYGAFVTVLEPEHWAKLNGFLNNDRK